MNSPAIIHHMDRGLYLPEIVPDPAAVVSPSPPLLWIHGLGEYSRSRLDEAGVRCQVVPEAGHWPFLDQPDLFLSLLTDFLDRI